MTNMCMYYCLIRSVLNIFTNKLVGLYGTISCYYFFILREFLIKRHDVMLLVDIMGESSQTPTLKE